MGFVSQSQLVYTRSGIGPALGTIGDVAFDQSIIPSYNLYVADTWHIKPVRHPDLRHQLQAARCRHMN